jgi:hypothetical protein
MGTFIRKLIPANIAGIIGIVQVIVPLVREIVIAAIRILDVLTPKKGLEPLIVKTVAIFATIEGAINSFKNMFLGE